MSAAFLVVFLPVAWFQALQALQALQAPQALQDLQDLQDHCPDGFCNPPLGDLMVGRASQLSASSTCGLEGPENYCIIGYLEEEQKCFTCDSRLPYYRYGNPNSHRIENVIATFEPERKLKWWQSENGVHRVSIQLDLETVFQFSHLVLKFKSFRPAAMLVERSKDFGRSWKVFRYFAEDCLLHFPSVPDQLASSIDEVVCDSRYSGSDPSTDGEVVLKALDPVFEIEDPYASKIQDLITVTNIRVNFTRLFTLGDTLLRKRRNPQDKYYYALYDMVVRGSCFCNGHASQCTPVGRGRGDTFSEAGMVLGRCVCLHNTAGENCERCEDFHHDSPWRPGGQKAADACRRCDCHGHSRSCHFDSARFEATGGASGGVCDDCRNNRTGPHCEHCQPLFYQDPQRAEDDPQACIPCDCDPAGSKGGGLCDPLTGQCVCKDNAEGQRCDRCKYGFYKLRADDPNGCQECSCHVSGTVGSCDQVTGSCNCDPLAVGPLCDRCQPGFWGLGNSLFRCSPCDCDIGGAQSTQCSAEEGQCRCLPNMVGRRCSDPAHGYFLPLLDYFLYEAELAAPLHGGASPTPDPPSSPLLNLAISPSCEQYYRQQGYDFKLSNGRIVLVRRTPRSARHRRQEQRGSIPLEPGHPLQIIPRQRAAGQPPTWTGQGLVRVQDGAGLRFVVDNLPSSTDYQLVIRYEPEAPSDWVASVTITPVSPGDGRCTDEPAARKALLLPGDARAAVLDAPACMNAGGRYLVDVVLDKRADGTPSSHILVDSMGLIPRLESMRDFCSDSDVDAFRRLGCVGLAAELRPQESLPELCEGLIRSLSARINAGAVACRCSAVGALGPGCSKLGGVCDCKPNVIGRCCDACAPMTFGFGPDGCAACDCDPRGATSALCDQVRGQCSCRLEVAGRRCDRCRAGYWAFPLCRACRCNGMSEECDPHTGRCLSCRRHSAGAACDRCEEGYYGDPPSGQPCEPCRCPDVRGSGRFFATSCRQEGQRPGLTCACREGHRGPSCDRCSPGYYGNLASPGASCQLCLCNNNIDPDDRNACDGVTGECLRCLHNTVGPQCQNCKPGYYGNALAQDCKECSCDRRGTEVTRCPLDSPCFCDPLTGQCPCRRGAAGILCDECEDGYWNMDGASGCRPCSCHPANSLSYICDQVTGQCPCRSEFGGRQCDECGQNHFGNPELQCISCDCNLDGTERPSCDPETGECMCRTGVTGIFCDDCAPGYDSEFPACKECHPCNAIWAEDVTDVQRASQVLKQLIPRIGEVTQPAHERLLLELRSKLDGLGRLTALAPPALEGVEELYEAIRDANHTFHQNRSLADPSPLDDHVRKLGREAEDLLNRVNHSLRRPESADAEELLDEIDKLNNASMLDEERARSTSQTLEESGNARREAELNLSTCCSKGDLAPLEGKVKGLGVLDLNRQICGGAGLNCSECGGALCVRGRGQRKCGGPNCEGILPASQKVSETAQRAADDLKTLPSRLEESKNKLNRAKQASQDTKRQAGNMQDRLSVTMDAFEVEKNKTKELIRRAKDFLMDDTVHPDDIERMARAVLSIRLPRSPHQIQSLIDEINNLLANVSRLFQDDLRNLEGHINVAQELLRKADDVRNRTKSIDVTEIGRDIYTAERAQEQAKDDLETGSRNAEATRNQVADINNTLSQLETKLMSWRPEDLRKGVGETRSKTEQNRLMAADASEAADAALQNATEVQEEMKNVTELFEDLKQKTSSQTVQEEGGRRLKNITDEVEEMKRAMEDKHRQIQELEDKIHQLIKRKEEKAAEVFKMVDQVESLRKDIAKRAEQYITCTT